MTKKLEAPVYVVYLFSALLGCTTIIVSVLRILMATTFPNTAVIVGIRAQSQRVIGRQHIRKQ